MKKLSIILFLLLIINNLAFAQLCSCNAVGSDICKPKYYISQAEAEQAASSGVSDAQIDIRSLGLKIQSQKTSKICYQYTSKSNETKIGIKFFLHLWNNINTNVSLCTGDRKYSVVTACDGSSLPVSNVTAAGFNEYEVKPSTKYSICLEVTKEASCNNDSTKIEISELYMYNAGNYCQGNIGKTTVSGAKLKNTNEYDLSVGDTLSIVTTNFVLPNATNGNTPGLGYMVFNQQPILPFKDVTPAAIAGIPGFKGITTSSILKDVNKTNSSTSISGATVLWFVPAIFDKFNGEKMLDSDLDRCVVVGNPIKVNYNPQNIYECGSCKTPNCPVNQVPFFQNRDYTKFCNELPAEIKDATYYSYHLVKTDSSGNIGLAQLISTSNTNIQLEIKRSATLRALANSCDTSLSIQPSVLNANSVQSGFNPEWYNLKPLTEYVAIIKTDIPASQPYVSGCLNAYGIKPDCNLNILKISGKDSLCVNELALYTPSIKGGKWTLSSSEFSMNGDSFKATKAGTVSITYVVQGSGYCINKTYTSIKKITINQNPLLGDIIGPNKLCSGDFPVVYKNVTNGGVWASSDQVVAAVASVSSATLPGTIAPKNPGKATISYTVTDGLSNCSSTILKQIVVFERPKAPTLSSVDSLCIGSTIFVTPSIKGGTWSTRYTSYISINQGYVKGIATGKALIEYTIKNDSTTCVNTVSKNILVKTVPVITISGPNAVCVGHSIQLTSSIPNGGWTSDLASVLTVSAGIVKGVKDGISTVSYSYDVPGCVSVASKKITVKLSPTAGTLTGANYVCKNSSVKLTPSVAGGTWVSLRPSIASIDAKGNVTGLMKTSLTAGVLSYTVTNASGCSASVTKDLGVDSLPVVPIISGPAKICSGGTAFFRTTNTSGVLWTAGPSLTASSAYQGVFTHRVATNGNVPSDNFNTFVKATSYSLNKVCSSVATRNVQLRTLASKSIAITAANNLVVNANTPVTVAFPSGLTTSNTTGRFWFSSASADMSVVSTTNLSTTVKVLKVPIVAPKLYFSATETSTGCGITAYKQFTVTSAQSIVDANNKVNTTIGVNVYPNPSNGIITLENISGANTISLVDMTGRTIKTVSVNAEQMNLNFSGIQTGKYMVQIVGENLNEVRSIVIE